MKKKQIIINTENLDDMYKLYKKYKKIIYKNTEFIYNGENQEINDMFADYKLVRVAQAKI